MKPLIEFLVTAGLALVFHLWLNLEREAYVVFVLGLLVTMAVSLLQGSLAHVQASVLTAVGRLDRFGSLVDSIADAEAVAKGREFLLITENILALLGRGQIPLTEEEYYYEATQCLGRCTREIQAVNAVGITDWIGKPQKQNYYRAQVEAHRRGVRISRVFVLHRVDLANSQVRQTIRQQHEDGILVQVVFRENLNFSGREGGDLPTNFVLFDRSEVIVRGPLLGLYYGKRTRAQSEVARFVRTYEILAQHARPVEEFLGAPGSDEREIVLASSAELR